MGKDSEYAIEKMKANPKLVKVYIAIVIVIVVLIVAAVAGNSMKKKKEDDIMKKCVASYAIQLDKLSYEIDKTTPHNFDTYLNACRNQKQSYIEGNEGQFETDVNGMWEKYKDEVIDGHDGDWYYNQVKL